MRAFQYSGLAKTFDAAKRYKKITSLTHANAHGDVVMNLR
jgi:hypothetical protein